MKPFATPSNWVMLGIRCHIWWMKKMGLRIGTTLERVFLGLGLAGEVGELCNLIKKEWRDGHDPARDEEIKKEIADVRGYLEHLAHSYEVDIDEITADKTNELIDRWPAAFERPTP